MRVAPSIIFVVAVSAILQGAVAYAADPFSEILKRRTVIAPAEGDDKMTELLKLGYNAVHAEIRVKYNYWQQGVGDADGLIGAIERFHALRLQIEPGADRRECLRQKLAFARQIEEECPKTKSQSKYQALCEIDEAAAKSFRLAAELELQQLTMGAGETETP